MPMFPSESESSNRPAASDKPTITELKKEAAATDYTHSSHHLILVPQHVTNKSSDQTQVQNQRLSVYDRIKQTEKFLGIKFRQVVSHCVRIL